MRRCSILFRALQRVDPLLVEFLAEHITRAPSNRPFSNDVESKCLVPGSKKASLDIHILILGQWCVLFFHL